MTTSQKKPLPYRVSNIAKQYILHFNHKKFWQIKFDRSKESVIIEAGKLLGDDQKDMTTIYGLSRKLPILSEVKDFMNKRINKKIQKGYELLPIREPPQEIVPEPSSSNLGKRSNPNTEEIIIQAEETSKKFHSNPPSPDHQRDVPAFPALEVTQEPHQENPQDKGVVEEVPQEDDKKNADAIEEEQECEEETAESTPKFIEEIQKVPPPSAISTQLQQDHHPPPEIPLFDNNISNVNTQLLDEDDISYKEEPVNPEKTLMKEEFLEKVNALNPFKARFGKPIFNAHEHLTLPSEWEDEDPTGWYLSKIRGGIRCIWNGFEMRTENGGLVNAPEFLMEALPKSPLDGELYMKNLVLTREEYEVAIKLEPGDENYDKIWIDMMVFVIYDAPGIPGNFEQRHEKLKEYFEDPEIRRDFVDVCLEDYVKCRGKNHAEGELEKALVDGEKGIRLTNPFGEYVKGVTKNVLEERKSRK